MNLATFTERVPRRPLWAHQAEAAKSDRFIVTVAGGRRSGKTLVAQVKALHVAFTHRNARILVVSPAIENSRNWIAELSEVIRGSRLAHDAVVDEQAQLVRLANGSEIRALPATSAQVRGRGRGLRLVIVDEAAFIPESVWRDALYTLFDMRSAGSQALLTCSPWGPPTHFFRANFERGRDGDPDYASYQWSMKDNPTLSDDFIERQRERIAPSEAAAEIDGIWTDAQGAYLPRSLLEANTAPFETTPLERLHGPAMGMAGTDWGVNWDLSGHVVIYRLPGLNPDRPRASVFAAVSITSWPTNTPLADVVADILASPAQLATCTPELNGVGAMPSQELASALRRRIADEEGQALERWRDHDGETAWGWTDEVPPPTRVAPVATTARTKMAAYGTIRNLLERGQLVLPNHPDLLRELAGLRYEQGERGLTRIEAGDPGLRDDLADSLALATSPFTRHGRVDCRLARLSRSAIPDADVPAVEDTVTTGGGLVVPRRPFLQSVNGPEVSLPAQLAAPAPPREPDAIERARTYLQTTRS